MTIYHNPQIMTTYIEEKCYEGGIIVLPESQQNDTKVALCDRKSSREQCSSKVRPICSYLSRFR
jgi:hypothetical protein